MSDRDPWVPRAAEPLLRIPHLGADFGYEESAWCAALFYPNELMLYFRLGLFGRTEETTVTHSPPYIRLSTFDLPPWKNSVLHVQHRTGTSYRLRLSAAKRRLVEEGLELSGLKVEIVRAGLLVDERHHYYPRE